MRTIGLTTGQLLEVITAYSAPMTQQNAVFPGPTWSTAGVFWMPINYSDGALEVIGLVSTTSNELHVRLWDLTLSAAVPNSEVVITTTKESRELSQPLPLLANHLYRIEIGVIGIGGSGTIMSAGMT